MEDFHSYIIYLVKKRTRAKTSPLPPPQDFSYKILSGLHSTIGIIKTVGPEIVPLIASIISECFKTFAHKALL